MWLIFSTEAFVKSEIWWTDRMTDTYNWQLIWGKNTAKTQPVISLLLFDPVKLLCGTFLLFCWVKDLLSCQNVNTIRLTHPSLWGDFSINKGTGLLLIRPPGHGRFVHKGDQAMNHKGEKGIFKIFFYHILPQRLSGCHSSRQFELLCMLLSNQCRALFQSFFFCFFLYFMPLKKKKKCFI